MMSAKKNIVMSIKRFFLISFVTSLVFSCATKKDIIYMQDIDEITTYSPSYQEYIIRIDDILKIDVYSETPEAALVFNPRGLNSNLSTNRESLLFFGYQVNSEGNINFPSLGKINAEGRTIQEIRDYIYNEIKENDILNNPSVDVKLLNAHFTILGEVNNPGKYDFLKNNLNILEAVGMAGDLTINGIRKDIKLIRDFKGKKTISTIDLTNKDILNGKNFQVFSGDIILVNPNTTRVRNAGIIGNSGTLLSLLSFILSSIIVISN